MSAQKRIKVVHTCGHGAHHMVFKNSAAAREEYLAGQPCPECQRAAASEKAAKAAKEEGLPALTGSEKQIAWAETIRQAAIKSLLDAEDYPRSVWAQINAKFGDKFPALVDALVQEQTSAKWWIDHRTVRSYLPRWSGTEEKQKFWP